MRLAIEALELPVASKHVELVAPARKRYGLGPIETIEPRAHRNALRIQRALLGHPDEAFLLDLLRKRTRHPFLAFMPLGRRR